MPLELVTVESVSAVMKSKYSSPFQLEVQKARMLQRRGEVKIISEIAKPEPAKIELPKVNKTKFFCFIGEFGYEILSSHGWVRKYKQDHPTEKIGIVTRAGAQVMYEDAYDYFVDITSTLANYLSDCFGVFLTKDDQQKVQDLCDASCKGTAELIWSNLPHSSGYGRQDRVASVGINTAERLQKQVFINYTLEKYKREINLPQGYVVLNDRRRSVSWDNECKISEVQWMQIIAEFTKRKIHVVLLGYKPYKDRDAYSIFHEKAFQNIPYTTNLSTLLTENRDENLIYQANVLKKARFALGIFSSSGYFPALLGVDSYMFTLGRKSIDKINQNFAVWNRCVFHNRLHAIDCTMESVVEKFKELRIYEK